MADWFIQRQQQIVGPFSGQQLQELSLAGKLSPGDLVRKGAEGEFARADRIRNLFIVDENTSRHTPPPPRLTETREPHPAAPALPVGRTQRNGTPLSWQPAFLPVLAIVALVSAGALFMTWNNSSADPPAGFQSGKAASPGAQDPASAGSGEHGHDMLPEYIRRHARTVNLPLADALDPFLKTHSDLSDIRVQFSPSSRLLFLLRLDTKRRQVSSDMDGKPRPLHIFRADTGSAVLPENSEIDYFSFPAILSPDESQLVCYDEGFLRIWKLKNTSSTLLQTIRLPEGFVERYGCRLSWRNNEVIAVSAKPFGAARPRRMQIYRRNEKGEFEEAGGIREFRGRTGSDDFLIEPSNPVASADGKEVYVGFKSPQGNIVQVKEYISGRTVRTLSLSGPPVWNWGLRDIEFPSTEINHRTGAQRREDSTSSLQLSPDGDYLLCAVGSYTEVRTEIYRTSNWQRIGILPHFTPLCFSHDGKRIAGYTSSTSRTDQGYRTIRAAVVHQLETSEQVMSVDMGEQFGDVSERRNDGSGKDPGLMAAFSADDSSLRIFYSKGVEYRNRWGQSRSKVKWVLGAWDVKTGQPEFSIGRTAHEGTVGEFALAKSGELLFSGLAMWNVSHLAALDRSLQEADEMWSEGKHAEALAEYAKVIGDQYSWFVEDALPRAYSRSIDILAKEDRVDDGRALVVAMQRLGVDASVETESGRKLINQFKQERLESQAQMDDEAGKREAARMKEANQALFRSANSMTKKEFVEKLRLTKSSGVITSHSVNAVFDDHSLQDVFGEPDNVVDINETRKLLQFRCSNGVVQLRAVIVGDKTTVSGIDYL